MSTIKKILILDANNNTSYTENAPKDSIGPIDVSTHYHLNILKTYDKDVYDPENALIFGCGPFAGSNIGGVYRATFFARSPLWKGLFSSNMGGVGIAPGANIGDEVALFEATHGTAPKYANLDKVNPGSLLFSGVMMLEYMKWWEAAALITKAYEATIAQKFVTYDFARQMDGAKEVKTSEFAAAVINNM